jgi:hypothetical protein
MLVLLSLILLFSLQSYWVQSFFGHQVTRYYADELNTEFSVESIKLNGFDFMEFNNILIRDLNRDTLAFFPTISIAINEIDFKNKRASIKSIVFNEPYLNLYLQKGDDKMNSDFIVNYFSNNDDKTEKSSFNVEIQTIGFVNTQFDYNDYNHKKDSTVFDLNHLGLSQFNTTINNFNTESADLFLNISELSLLDKSGFLINNLDTKLSFSSNEIRLDSTLISTPYSTISSALIALNYEDISDINDFFNKVDLKSEINFSKIGLKDLAFFDSNFGKGDQEITINGKLNGKLSKFNIDDLFIGFSGNSYLNSHVLVSGLPDIENTVFELIVKDGKTSKKDLDNINFMSFGLSSDIQLPTLLDEFGLIDLYGEFKGSYTDFESHFHVASAVGLFDGSFKAFKSNDEYNYDGKVDVMSLNLRTLIDDDNFKTLNANFNLKGKGFSLDDIDVAIDGELIDFVYKGYPYEDVIIKGDLKEKAFIGSLDLIDQNVNLSFDGNFDLTQSPILFDFEIDLINANLNQLNLVENRKDASIGFNLYTSGFGSNLDDFSGMIDISKINYNENGINYYFDSILFDSQSNDYFHSISFHSKIAEFELSGQYHFNTMFEDLYSLGSSVFPSILPPEKSNNLSRENFVMNARVNDISKLSLLFFPELEVSPNTSILCEYNSISQMLDIKAHSDWLNYNGLELINLNIDTTKKQLFNNDTSYILQVSVDNVIYENNIDVQNLNFESRAFSDNFEVDINWMSIDSSLWGYFNSSGKLLGDGDFDLFIHPARFSSSKTGDWFIKDTTLFHAEEEDIQINNFTINNSDQKIYVDGFLSRDPEKELNIDVQEISLENINSLLGINDFELNGSFNLTASIKNIYNEMLFSSKALIYGIELDEYEIGDMSLLTSWDSDLSRINMSGGLMNEIHDEEIEIEESYYIPDFTVEDQLDLNLSFNDLNIDFLNSFLPEDFLSNMSGKIKGSLKIDGSWSRPELNGEINLKDGEITLDEFNTDYSFGGDIIMRPDEILINQIPIRDNKEAVGELSAFFIHDNFSSYSYNIIGVFPEPFLVMNTNYEMNPLYYGDAYITGYTTITYDSIYDLEIIVDVKTEDKTVFTLPLYGAEDVVLKDFISFKTKEILEEEIYEVNLDGISLELNVDLTEDAEFELIFDDVVGDAIKARGEGHVDLLIDQFYNFSMFGKYKLREGEYLFTLKDFINKKFIIEPGGEISWYGDPYNADVDITAIYPLKTRLSEIMPVELREDYKQKTDVKVNMNLKNNLFNPDIAFGVELPRANDDAKTALSSLISTEQGMNKQVFSLLILNKFMTHSMQDGIADLKSSSNSGPVDVMASVESATNEVLSNVGSATSEVLSNQLSNMISKFSDDFDIGFNYTPGDLISNDEVTVAMSTQQFNDRLNINTNLGVSQGNKLNKNPSSFIGDVDVEYKLNSQGNLRVHAFNKSNEYDMSNLNQSNYTQGLGTFYKQSFNNLGELFCEMGNVFKSKANKCDRCVSKEGRKECD